MASNFRDYAKYYDSLYSDKDYDAESEFVASLLAGSGIRGEDGAAVLDLGCGTGGHMVRLARRGYRVVGVDRSAEMISIATEKMVTSLPAGERFATEPQTLVADVRDFKVDGPADGAVMMFAVVSYLTSDRDLADAFANIRAHLRDGGLFVFDGWYAPGVEADPPTNRSRTITLPDGASLTREARPVVDSARRTVRVNYELTLEVGGEVADRVVESHDMRYRSTDEIEVALNAAGFELVSVSPELRPNDQPSSEDWTVVWVARAITPEQG